MRNTFNCLLACALLFAMAACSENPEKQTIYISGTVDLESLGEQLQGPVFVGVMDAVNLEELESESLDSVVDIISVDPEDPEFVIDLSDRGLKAGDRISIIAFVDNDYDNRVGMPDPTAGDIIGFYRNEDNDETEYTLAAGMNEGIEIRVSRRIYDFEAGISGTVLGDETGKVTIVAYAGNIDSSDFDDLNFDGVIGFVEIDKGAGPVAYRMDILPFGYNVPIENVNVFAMLDIDGNGEMDAGEKIGYYSPDPDSDRPEALTIREGSLMGIDLEFTTEKAAASGLDIRIKGNVSLPENLPSSDAPVFILVTDSENMETAGDGAMDNIKYFQKIPAGSSDFEIDLSTTDLQPGDEVMVIALLDRNYQGGFPNPDAGDFIGFYVDDDELSAAYRLNLGLNEGIDIDIRREVFDFEAQATGVVSGPETGDLTLIAYAGEITSSDFSKLDFDHVIGVKELDKTEATVAYAMDIMPYGHNLPIENVYVFAFLDVNRNGETDAGDRYGYYTTDTEDERPTFIRIANENTSGIDIELTEETDSPSGYTISLEGTFSPPAGFEEEDFPIYLIVALSDGENVTAEDAMDDIKYFERIESMRDGFQVNLEDTALKPGDKILVIGLWDRNHGTGFPEADAGDYIGFHRDTEGVSAAYTLVDGVNTGIEIPVTREVFDFDAQITGTVEAPETGKLTLIAYAGDIASSDFSKLNYDAVVGFQRIDKNGESVEYSLDILPYGFKPPIENVYLFALLDVNMNDEIDGGDKIGFYSDEDGFPLKFTVNEGVTPDIDIAEFSMDVGDSEGYEMSLRGTFTIPYNYDEDSPPIFLILAAIDDPKEIFDNPMSAIKYFYKMPPGEFYFDIDLENTTLKPGDSVMVIGLWDRDFDGGFPKPTRGDKIGFLQNSDQYSIALPLQYGENLIPREDYEFNINRLMYDFESSIMYMIDRGNISIYNVDRAQTMILSVHVNGVEFQVVPGRVNVKIDMDYALGMSVIKPPEFDPSSGRDLPIAVESMREHQLFPAVYQEILVWENNPRPRPLIQGVYNQTEDKDETAYLFAIIDTNGNGQFDVNNDYIGYYNQAINATDGTLELPGNQVVNVAPGTYYIPRPINIISKGRNTNESGAPYWIDFGMFDPA